jgi:hypothetical protein
MAGTRDDSNAPIGSEFHQACYAIERRVEAETERDVLAMGVKAPLCMERLGALLSYLDRLAACWWGCQEGNHAIEYLVARAVGYTRGSLRLMRGGFYDEALSLTRTVAEIANLLTLFSLDHSEFARWCTATDGEIKKTFSPVKVRIKIENIGGRVPFPEEDYALLCKVGTHPNPQVAPQAFNEFKIPHGSGVVYQQGGFLACLNEMATALSLVTVTAPGLIGVDGTVQQLIRNAAADLLESVGDFDLSAVGDYQEATRNAPGFAEAEAVIKARLKVYRESRVASDPTG